MQLARTCALLELTASSEKVAESIVLPHMDDIAFFDTKPYGQRGGIYGECARRASDLRSEVGDGMEPAIETEDGQIPPGVPNVKLGDPKISSEDNMRQRNGRPRKSSTSDSLLSTKSVPIAALGGKDKPLAFSLASHGTSMSLDHPSHESKHHKHKDHDHSRKKSWFSSSGKASITATRSQSAVPLSSEKASQHEQSSPLPFPSEVGEPASDTTVSAAPVVNPESGEAAVLKLKELLQAGKQRSSSERASSAAENRENSVYPLPEVAALSASPEPSLYRTSSGSSSGTAQAPQKEVVDTTSPSNPPHASSNGKVPGLMRRSSDKSHMSTGPVASENKQLQNPFTDESSISSTSDSASIQTNNSGTSSNIAILQNWKTKATDKQAIQASVNQARDAMSKWGSKWQAYRQAQHAAAEAEKLASIQIRAAHDEHSGQVSQQPSAAVDSVFPSYQDGTAVTPHTSRSSKQDGKLTPETRSRSSSLLSTSPKGQFQPSPATTTTSLSGISGITALNEVDNPSSTQKSPTVRRVPPPSAVPVHPAVGTEADRAPPPKRKSYTPAPRMSIPGIDDSRRFHVSSADVAQPKASPPPLPSRKPVPAEEEAPKQSPKRIPPPTLVEAQGDLPDPTVKLSDQAVVSATSGPPPLPPRHVNDEDGAVAGVQTVPMDGLAHIPTLPATTKLPHDDTALELPEAPAAESFASPEVFVQPPTPSDTVTGQKNESAGV